MFVPRTKKDPGVIRASRILASFAFLILGLGVPSAWAAELVMFRRAGCPYCLTWDRAIGTAYPKSDLGQRFPLRKIDLDRDPPLKAKLARRVHFTPTFVLVEDGQEVGRIEGYPGEDFFWGLLEKLGRSLSSLSGTTLRSSVVQSAACPCSFGRVLHDGLDC
jgi:hypothetical protein